jgi:glycosyltransferase involved in cell wall biosynthesis
VPRRCPDFDWGVGLARTVSMSSPDAAPATSTPVFGGAVARGQPYRIALVISSLGGGGAERIVSGLAMRWARLGLDVSVVTLGSRTTDAYDLDPRVRRVTLDLVRPSRHAVEGLVQASRRIGALRRALVSLRPDVIVSFMTSTNVLVLLAAIGKRPRVFVCERTDPRRERVGPYWAALRRLLYPLAAGIVVQTESVSAWARAMSSRVHVIPNFVERPAVTAAPGKDRGPRRLIAFGRLSPEKGFDLLIDAFARIADRHPDWSLTILGEGPERPALEALVTTLRMQGRISLPGRVSDPTPHLAASHAFALPSRHEGFPNALLEAMAAGLPVVAFDCLSGPGEIVVHEQNGLLVAAGDVTGLAAALARLMRDPAERVRMGKNATDIAVALSPESVLGRWNELVLPMEKR